MSRHQALCLSNVATPGILHGPMLRHQLLNVATSGTLPVQCRDDVATSATQCPDIRHSACLMSQQCRDISYSMSRHQALCLSNVATPGILLGPMSRQCRDISYSMPRHQALCLSNVATSGTLPVQCRDTRHLACLMSR